MKDESGINSPDSSFIINYRYLTKLAKTHGVIAPARADKIRIAIQMNAFLPGVGSFRDLALSTLLKPLRDLTAFRVMLDTGMLSGVLNTAIVILPFWLRSTYGSLC
jgi:hypothetical protein